MAYGEKHSNPLINQWGWQDSLHMSLANLKKCM